MAKYHIVTWHRDCGEDDKQDCNSMQEVNALARQYVSEGYIVRVFSNHRLVKVYDDCFRRGRKPSAWETEQYESK